MAVVLLAMPPLTFVTMLPKVIPTLLTVLTALLSMVLPTLLTVLTALLSKVIPTLLTVLLAMPPLTFVAMLPALLAMGVVITARTTVSLAALQDLLRHLVQVDVTMLLLLFLPGAMHV